MHYYPWNIEVYKSHTEHLNPLEDIAYRRMLDWTHLHEKGLPRHINEISRLIRMRGHDDSIEVVLDEFWKLDKKTQTWLNKAAQITIKKYRDKSEKAKQSAEARWNKAKGDANALRTECEGNANKELITNNKELKRKRFAPPTCNDVKEYMKEIGVNGFQPQRFVDHYESNGWMVGKNKMKSWKAAVRSWGTRNEKSQRTNQPLLNNDTDW